MARQDLLQSAGPNLGTCAVTGSSGWLASCLVSKLTQQGHKVHCLDIRAPSSNSDQHSNFPIDHSLITFYYCDITNYDQVFAALCAVDTVFHVCSVTDIRLCPIDSLYDVNVTGTRMVMKACKVRKVKRLIYTSSIDAVHEGKATNQIKESECQWIMNGNPYGGTKALAEQLVLGVRPLWSRRSYLSVAVLRVTHLYGPGDPIMNVMSKFPIRIGDEKCRFSLVYIENCAIAHIQTAQALLSKEGRSLCDQEIFNVKDHDFNFPKWYREILNEDETPNLYLPVMIVRMFAYIYDFMVWILFMIFGLRIGHPVEAFGALAINSACQEQTFCGEKFKKLVGYNPPIDVQQSVRRTREWREHQNKKHAL